MERYDNIDIYLEDYEYESKESLDALKKELENDNDIIAVKKEEHLFVDVLVQAILIKLIATLVIELLKKTDAWDKFIKLIQKIFKIGKKHSSQSAKFKIVLKYQSKEVKITSDSEIEIFKKLEELKNFI